MSDTDKNTLNVAADTPDGQGGGGGTAAATEDSSTVIQKPLPTDPPDGSGGGTQP